jgi:HNH endonuclease
MAAPVSVRLRQEVAERAAYRCEYCGLPQRFALHAHEPDHIVPRQHGGESHLQNLAWACLRCNRYKGPNVGSFDPETGRLVPFFNLWGSDSPKLASLACSRYCRSYERIYPSKSQCLGPDVPSSLSGQISTRCV